MPGDTRMITDSLEALLLPPEGVRIGLVAPLSGVLGLVGPSALNCAVLAAGEVNAAGGLAGRPVELVAVDGGRPPREVAAEVSALVAAGAVDAVVGTHASDVRLAVTRALAGAAPYVFTPPFEGGPRAPGQFLLGETPARQLLPALDWLIAHRRARRWYLLGNDYVWPRLVHAAAARHLRARGAVVAGERFVPYGFRDHEPLLDAISAARADAVLLSLVGSDLVAFNRACAESGRTFARLCGALEEHGLLGAGGDASGELYAAMGYFGGVTTDAGLGLAERYARRFGPGAPLLNAHAQGCYEGVLMTAELIRRAGSASVAAVEAVADGTAVTGGRGRLTLADGRVDRGVHLARADGLDFDVIAAL
ncbi:substrate-binding domain-containing protein [Bailinhaonella thermotolerans]|uniref:substrate-binding domain-containing protein n=1 Tax=Bailinhaonella thermotolerans TaxID=1070861 RepID=UPI001F5BC4D6|nr:substrate-binding domain-containing protein [Bailinhaonella thermotolerans]